MALKNRDAYKALEDIVSSKNISEHPAVLDSYAYQWGAELFTNTPYLPRAGAVVLPGNTQEVQSIVRVCNKYNVRYKAFSTGWGFYSALGLDDTAIQMDLRRMNRIIEINEKSMYAVVEPYVTSAQLQAELMKKGFNLNIIGAGANCTAFPVAAHQGLGHTSLSTSYGPRNLLGVEWVLPDGDILKIGSVGSGAGWFCGDGPGPSLRGILRGPQTVMGGLGVFTKAATKIYPWPGPAQPEIEGKSPYYRFKERPKNMDLHYVVFPDWDLFIEAIIEIAKAEICFAQTRLAPPMLAQGLSGNNDEGADLLGKLQAQIKERPGFCLITTGNSEAELKYREKVLRHIVAGKKGSFIEYFENEDVKREYIWAITRSTIAIREVFRGTGRFLGSIGDSSMFLTSFKMMLAGMPLKRQFQEKGKIRGDEGLDCIWGTPIEFGHNGHAESLVQIHPTGESWGAVMEYSSRCEDMAIKEKFPAPVTVWGDMAHDKWGPHLCNYHLWLRKIKKAFDPKGVSEPAMYISAKDVPLTPPSPLKGEGKDEGKKRWKMNNKKELEEIVGKKNVFDSIECLDEFSKDESFVNPVRPRYIVKTNSTNEVQRLVKWANETGTPLIPVSSGAPHFKGDTVPSIGGAVVVDLRGMKTIIRIDSENRIAIVEPGVTFSELIPRLKNNNLRLNMPLLPRSSKSVIGSLLEREPVIMPRYHWDLTDPLACTEVIYGSGDLFRTGSAAGPGTLEEQWEVGAAQNEASGPVQADFSRLIQGAQGTMGIVTWASIRCEQLPVLEEPFLVGSSNLDNLLDLIRLLVNARLVDDCLVLNNTNLAHIIGQEGSQDYESIKASLPDWILFYTISGTKYFPEEKVKYQIQDSSDHAKSLNLEMVRQIGEATAFDIIRILHKPPNGSCWKLQPKGSCFDIFFLTTCDRLSKLNGIMRNLAAKNDYPILDMGIYIQPLLQGVCYHCEYNLFFNSNNPIESNAVRELSTSAFDPLANGGGFFSRPYGPWASFAYRRDTQSTIGIRKVKGIFDPNNILNPGKLCF